ncbi:acyl-CoA dehydrogenase [Microvirga thermotolerans]|uniref:Acyl-coenzyme A dehydrogenase n=1 Tax=Microvirga thermotolerans TaxID=2651334 RepID=A0A5P9JSC1_9HYPH|nr:acyl-CoA dehydrogenase [Microvirga thermotolerans]QFU15527.1 acyl-CoA dehydrogenase [Microvirga thermotolerans]
MTEESFRLRWLSRPAFRMARKAMPGLSATEREAIEAGDVWWDGDLFTGNPDWDKLLAVPPARLSAEEEAFLAGPVETLCAMLDDWRITWTDRDLPEEAWSFLKQHRFLGMIIPREYGGLGFSAYAHSEVVRKVSTRSVAAAVAVMVPNSLGPGELLLRFGTEEQRNYWLPRLADGREIPCFGLTSPEAGSDAASMTDEGIVCRGEHEGREVLGIRLNWHKRYITLGPVATVLGLAFKLRDPERLLGREEEIGITVALVRTDAPGVSIGRRHIPSFQMFQNGPNEGRDVFIPLDQVIGGPERVGQGWRMLMSALAAGRGISLPSLSAAGAAFAAHTSGAYARVREQFHLPIGRFEGVQEKLAALAGTAYLLDAARRFTCAGLDRGHHPAVISGIMKLQATERMRTALNDAMDIHGGKAVIDGPLNYLGNFYRAIPVGITVEGANILTRCLIVFGQGAIRSHPFLLQEILALGDADEVRGLAAFDRLLWRHVGHTARTFLRAWLRSWSGGLLAPAPRAGAATRFYRQLGRYAAGFALAADFAFLTMGGALKRRELISARFGDILSELFLLSAALKRWQDEGRRQEDLPLLRCCMARGRQTIEARFAEIFANLPNRPVAWLLKLIVLPLGARALGPSDALVRECAEILLEPSAARDRLTPGLYRGQDDGGLARLERAFALVVRAQPIRDRLGKEGGESWRTAHGEGKISDEEARLLQEAEAAVAAAIAVDSFAPEDMAPGSRRKDAAASASPEETPPGASYEGVISDPSLTFH